MRKYDNRGDIFITPCKNKITQCLSPGIGIMLCFITLATATNEDASIYLGSLVPTSGPYQTIEGMMVSWDGKQVRDSSPCVDVLKLSGPVEAGTSKDVVIEYDVSVSHGIVVWPAKLDSCQLLPQCMGEFSRLMVALCRASEIPSLVVSGGLLPDLGPFVATQTRTGDHPGVSHAWVEFSYRDIWSMADPAGGRAPGTFGISGGMMVAISLMSGLITKVKFTQRRSDGYTNMDH